MSHVTKIIKAPAQALFEVQDLSRRIAKQKEVVKQEKTPDAALVLQQLQEDRKEAMSYLPKLKLVGDTSE